MDVNLEKLGLGCVVKMNEEIKNCPFCGGEVSISEMGDEKKHWYLITRGTGENHCKCRLFMESDQFYDEDPEMVKNDIKKNLIEAWNRQTCSYKKREEI